MARRPHNPRRSAAEIIAIGDEYPSTLSEGERALIVEVKALRAQLENATGQHKVWIEAAYRWREKWLAACLEVEQARGELGMARLELAGYREALAPLGGERHD